jgi:hypothetical protein
VSNRYPTIPPGPGVVHIRGKFHSFPTLYGIAGDEISTPIGAGRIVKRNPTARDAFSMAGRLNSELIFRRGY